MSTTPRSRFRRMAIWATRLAVVWTMLCVPALAQRLPPDAEMIDGFEFVVFGAEFTGRFSDSSYLKKFAKPVRVHVDNQAEVNRSAAVRAFVRQVGRQVQGLDIAMARRAEEANFVVHVVDRVDYLRVGREVYRRPFGRIPGNCIVRASYSRSGITRSDAIIVSDEGDTLFQRCLIEELLQGLGPLNDDANAPQSVFNDTTKLTTFTSYDRVILNMLYDERLKPGMSRDEASPLLGEILRDTKRRLRF